MVGLEMVVATNHPPTQLCHSLSVTPFELLHSMYACYIMFTGACTFVYSESVIGLCHMINELVVCKCSAFGLTGNSRKGIDHQLSTTKAIDRK